MSYNILFTKSAAKDYKNFNESIKSQINTVLIKLEKFGTDSPNTKPLTGQFKGYFRIRTGDYRIVFSLLKETITIISILNRNVVYKKK